MRSERCANWMPGWAIGRTERHLPSTRNLMRMILSVENHAGMIDHPNAHRLRFNSMIFSGAAGWWVSKQLLLRRWVFLLQEILSGLVGEFRARGAEFLKLAGDEWQKLFLNQHRGHSVVNCNDRR